MIDFFLQPLSYAFVLRALAAGLLAALSCALLSSFVVWRGMAFMGDAMAHAILPGIVLAYAAGVSLLIGALGATVIAVWGIGAISNRGGLREDTAIGIVFSGLFALGILLLNRIASYQDLSHILFGNILGVNASDLAVMSLVTLAVAAVILLGFKEFLVASFDPAHAVAIGLSPNAIRYVLLALLGLTTVVAIQTVGVVLVLALLVTPAAIAMLITKRLGWIIGLSVLSAVLATLVGFYASYYADFSSGASIVLTLIVFFLLALTYSSVKKRLTRKN